VAIGDANNDGKLDLIFANDDAENQVCFGDGVGGFVSPCSDINSDTNRSFDVAVGDLNIDGNLDTIFANNGQINRICLGDGAGNLSCSNVSGDQNNTRGVAITPPDVDHFLAYSIKRSNRGISFEPQHVGVSDQFGELILDVVNAFPIRLLIPAAKSLTKSVEPLLFNSHNVDNYLCYTIKHAEDTLKFISREVSVLDQFEQPLQVTVSAPKMLCNPTSKNKESIKNPENHLICYVIKSAKGEPRHIKVKDIFTNDQFASLQVDTTNMKALCVPSSKKILEVK